MANEKRLVDVDVLTETIENIDWYHVSLQGNLVHGARSDIHTPLYKADDIYHALENAPTVDAVEVVHGRWEHDSIGFSDFWTCSACRKDFFFDDDPTVMHARFNYCPNCGAKMDGDGNE